MPITVIIDSTGGPKALKRELRPATAATMGEIGEDWHDNKLQKHFLDTSTREYRYKRRGQKYRMRKAKGYTDKFGVRHAGHSRALVWSGESEKMLTSQAQIRTTQAGGVSVKMFGPFHFYAYRKDLDQPDKAAEVVTISNAEATEYVKLLHKGVADKLQRSTTRETTIIA